MSVGQTRLARLGGNLRNGAGRWIARPGHLARCLAATLRPDPGGVVALGGFDLIRGPGGKVVVERPGDPGSGGCFNVRGEKLVDSEHARAPAILVRDDLSNEILDLDSYPPRFQMDP